MSTESERKKKASYRRGNVVSPEPASDQSAIQNVFDFLQDYVPQAVSGPKKEEQRERVLWASFETGDVNDLTMEHLAPPPGGNCSHLPLLLTLGFANGFSIWMINPGGDAKELYAVYGDGETARTVRLLKTPEVCDGVSPDKFADQRPIIAIVKKGRHSQTGSTVAYSTMQLISLRTAGSGESVVRKFVFKSRAIANVECNRRVIAIVFQKRIVVLDTGSFETKFVIRNNYPSIGYPCNPIALGQRWIAFSETKLISKHQSVGGMSHMTPASMATTVLKNVKKGISALTETISGLTGKGQPSMEDIEPLPQVADITSANVVSILDTCQSYPQEVKLQDLDRESGVVAHFLAHAGANVHIAALAFNPSGNLLVTASTEGHNFHVFNILPHPWFSSEAAVHHLYTLFRGATSGVVQDISVAMDSRWVAVSTLNGTSHIFPITPYGGDVTVRTHTSKRVVNKLSRFHTTAGMESFSHSHSQSQNLHNSTLAHTPSSASTSSSPPTFDQREFPSSFSSVGTGAVNSVSGGGSDWNNPRALPLPSPVCVTALQQVKQPYLTNSESGSSGMGASGSITSPRKLSGSFDSGEPFVTLSGPDSICVRASFATPGYKQAQKWGRSDSPEKTASYSLYVIGSNGVLTEHVLQPQKLSSATDGEDAPVELTRFAKTCWRLMTTGTLFSGSIPLPLSKDNPLISANNDFKMFIEKSTEKDSRSAAPSSDQEWLSQVEILTYAPPSRRLWMGPQFSFKAYGSSTAVSPSINSSSSSTSAALTSSSAILHTPSPPNTVIYSSSLNSPNGIGDSHLAHNSFKIGVRSSPSQGSLDLGGGGRRGSPAMKLEGCGGDQGEQDGALQSAVLFPSPDNPLLDLLSDSLEVQNLPGAALPSDSLPSSTQHAGKEGAATESGSLDRGVVEVFGSWKKVAPHLESSVFDVDVEKQLEEAMTEHDSQSITVVATGATSAKTGFYTHDES